MRNIGNRGTKIQKHFGAQPQGARANLASPSKLEKDGRASALMFGSGAKQSRLVVVMWASPCGFVAGTVEAVPAHAGVSPPAASSCPACSYRASCPRLGASTVT